MGIDSPERLLIRMSQIESGQPTSINNTSFSGFLLSQFAKTHPVKPSPTMMKSYVLFMA